MIIPAKTVCDICKRELVRGDRIYKIKHKTIFEGSAGSITERGYIELCGSCMAKFRVWVNKQLKEQKNERTTDKTT